MYVDDLYPALQIARQPVRDDILLCKTFEEELSVWRFIEGFGQI